jgi:superfamily II DNA or RNA helicase
MKIKSIKKIDNKEDVYNLRIKSISGNNHNYIANGILVSNCHQAQSTSIKKIMSLCTDSKWRFGLSGTITNKSSAEYLTIQQFLGPLIMEISPKFLFDNKYATPVLVKVVKMDWIDPEIKEKLSNLKKSKTDIDGKDLFNIEKKLVIGSEKRLSYIVNFVNKVSKNSLVLFNSVGEGYGKRIYDGIREISDDKEVFYIDGDTNPDTREIFINKMEEGENKILVASFGTLSTGISIKKIHNIFLTESYKSEIVIKQTIGRGMRLSEGKEIVNIIDFVDDFSTEESTNYLMQHSKERIEIYKREKYQYKIYEVKL